MTRPRRMAVEPPPLSAHAGTGLAALAGLLADETRAAFCVALLDGRAWTAGELARWVGVAPSTASAQLDRLAEGGLLAEVRQGRYRYVRLADARVAQLVEELTAHSTDPAHQVTPRTPPRSLRAAGADEAMARARTCYDHLAGRLGVLVADAMTARGLLVQDTGFALTDDGMAWFEEVGIRLVRGSRRPLARPCLDWTERRTHLAGAAGAALCRHALDTGWCVRIGTHRAVKVTAAGAEALETLLGIPGARLATFR